MADKKRTEPKRLEPGEGDVVVVLADANRTPERELIIPTEQRQFALTVGDKASGTKRFYYHAATDDSGRWIYVPNE